jgi:hypothetical protein
MTLKHLAIAVCTLTTPSLPALAQDKSGPNLGTPASDASPSGAATLTLAQELYALGAAQGDAVTVLAAAKLAASVLTDKAEPAPLDPATIAFDGEDQKVLRKTATSAGAPTAPAPVTIEGTPRAVAKATFFAASSQEEGAADGPVSVDAMFAKARGLAVDDEALTGLIEDAQAEGSRGRVGSAVEWLSRLPSGQTDVWEIPFSGNSHAEVAVIGDGDTNLDVAVTDENGNVICYDVSWSDKLYCDWTPAWDGFFYVTVQNLGTARNSYSVLTN